MAPQRSSEEEQGEKGFTVSDKRLFTREGERRAGAEEPETPPSSAPPPPPRREAPQAQERPPRDAGAGGARRDLPAAEFHTLVAMLANNAMMLMGQLPDPVTQQRRRDLGQAQHMIDMLMMLREKTQGNLTAEEEQLMQELLPQLQMAFVHASRQVG